MKLKPFDTGVCGVPQLFHLGTVKFNTDGIATGVKIASIPSNVIVLDWLCKVTIAFNAAANNVLVLGSASDDDAFMGANDITEGTQGWYRKSTTIEKKKAPLDVYAKYTQTGTAATAGKAEFYALAVFTPEDWIPVDEIELNKSTTTIVVEATETLTVAIKPGDADNKGVTWSSSDEEKATVDSAGEVTAVAAGKAIITATSKDNPALSDSCEVTVAAGSP